MASLKTDIKEVEIPDVVVDPSSKKSYQKGRFLGKGGFAKCYELTDLQTKEVFAGKVVPKTLLIKPHQREKMKQEIDIHRGLDHKHVVGFRSFFEDEHHVYIILELCRRRSLMELHRRRRAVTEPECRYFVRQIALACDFLHRSRIIHRDLKLGNLFLNDEMEVKIGDFGLATRLDFVGERKKTLCGTPNYIAPEVLGKKGHSYEVDSWSLGCIVYTLLVGKPPFETNSLKDTYARIKKNDYQVPARVCATARSLIQRLLQPDPSCRPTMAQVLDDEFFTSGCLPVGLPTSCLTLAPRLDQLRQMELRKPLGNLNECENALGVQPAITSSEGGIKPEPMDQDDDLKGESETPKDFYIGDLQTVLKRVMDSNPTEKGSGRGVQWEEIQDPAAVPIYWVSKWVDYSDKYGLGYQLCDNSIGVIFNDVTRLILTSNAQNMQYVEQDGAEHLYTISNYPKELTKKVTLLKYFRDYMNDHLLKAGENLNPREGDRMTRLPFLRSWSRTKSAIVLHLSNGTLQINFFSDHTKIIICPLMQAVTYISDTREAYTYRLSLIEEHGCGKTLGSRLRYALSMAERLSDAAVASCP